MFHILIPMVEANGKPKSKEMALSFAAFNPKLLTQFYYFRFKI